MNNSKYIKYASNYTTYLPKLTNEDQFKQCAYLINQASNITILTGAGISTNCGIPDFRSKEGLYSKKPDDILSFSNFRKQPLEVYDFLYTYYKLIQQEPSISHHILKKLESLNKNINIITQNIDRLHHKAKSSNIIEFHGNLATANCILCNKEFPSEYVLNDNILSDDFNFYCECGGQIKPNIVLFGEDLKEWTFAQEEVSKSDLLIVIGTSLQVFPFADLPLNTSLNTPIIIINKELTYLDNDNMSISILEDCDKALTQIFNYLTLNDF